MAYSDTVLKQLIALVPRYEFDALAKVYHAGQKFRSYNRWSQFLAMLIGQMSGRRSLRDITDNLKAQGQRLYHLGMKKTCKATLARVNAEQPATLYQALFARLLSRCQLVAPKHRFSFQGKLYLLDATVINLLPVRVSLGRVSAEKRGHQVAHRAGRRWLYPRVHGHDQRQGARDQLGQNPQTSEGILLSVLIAALPITPGTTT